MLSIAVLSVWQYCTIIEYISDPHSTRKLGPGFHITLVMHPHPLSWYCPALTNQSSSDLVASRNLYCWFIVCTAITFSNSRWPPDPVNTASRLSQALPSYNGLFKRERLRVFLTENLFRKSIQDWPSVCVVDNIVAVQERRFPCFHTAWVCTSH